MVIDQPMYGVILRACVECMLTPTPAPGDVVVMDNSSSHEVASIRRAIEARGAILSYLSPSSPDPNPIEIAFAKFKALLCKAAERSAEALWRRIRSGPAQ